MLPNIKTLLGKKTNLPAGAHALAERMPHDEGMGYRREMLHQSIRESMLAMEVLSNMYKFKVVNLDQQHESFIAMVEVSRLFEARWNGAKASFAQIEKRMITGALHRAGVHLQAVFWRVDETVDSYTPPAPAVAGHAAPARRREIPGDVSHASARLAQRQAEAAPGEPRQAYLAATKMRTRAEAAPAAGQEAPARPAPQEGATELGGTQYGQL